MAANRKSIPDLDDRSYMDEDLEESLLDATTNKLPIRSGPPHSRSASTQHNVGRIDASKEHEANLRQELANVRKVNAAIGGLLESLEKAKANVKNVNQTVGNASSLLNIWTRILSQTEHNQRLILDPSWQGTSQDLEDIESEAQARQRAAERREAEEQERKAAAVKKAEEERRREEAAAASATKPKAGVRGRGGYSRGTGSSRAGYTATGNSTGTYSSRGPSSTRRTTSGFGRGSTTRTTRGQG